MDARTVMAAFAGEPGDEVALDAAAALAAREGAHLEVLSLAVEPMEMDLVGAGVMPVMAGRLREEAEALAWARAEQARARLPADLSAAVEPMVVPSLGLVERLARRMRLADLAVAGRPYGRGRGALSALIAEAALFGAGLPLLVVPDGGVDLSRPWDRVCLAWNDGDEALRAARAALPALKAASQVDVAVVAPSLGAEGEPGAALALWLSRHGVRAEVSVLARTERTVAEVLVRFARERGCEALVMGAFGHSRLREAVLGGATRDLLATAPLPILLAR